MTPLPAGEAAICKKKKRSVPGCRTLEQLPRCIVGMEACLGAHFVSGALRGITASHVKPFNKGQKSGCNDAEAALRPNLPTVPERTQDQLDLQALHRVRAPLVSPRTATSTRSAPL